MSSTAQKPKAAKRIKASPTTTSRRTKEDYAQMGAATYSERRLLDIAETVEKIRFLLVLWSVLSVVAVILIIVAASS